MADEYRFKDQLKKLGDVVITNPQKGDRLEFDGEVWRNVQPTPHVGKLGGCVTPGLFNFHADTSIAEFAGQINSFLKLLTPPSPPPLSSSSISLCGVPATLSFGRSKPIKGYANVSDVDVDQLFDVTNTRLGVVNDVNDVEGVLNDSQDGVFGDAQTGSLILEVNGTPIRAADLTLTNATSQEGSGFKLSAIQSIKAPSGDPFDGKVYRTGQWKVTRDKFRPGWNTVRIRHALGNNTYRDTQTFDFVWDPDAMETTFFGEVVSSVSMSGEKYLSGVKYYTSGVIGYGVTIGNLYKNTYTTNAVEFNGDLTSNDVYRLLPSGGNPNRTVTVVKNLPMRAGRVVGVSFRVGVVTLRPGRTPVTSPGVTVQGVLYDAVDDGETGSVEDFSSESWRLLADSDFDSVAITPNWVSSRSISDKSGNGYKNGLMVSSGQLLYPRGNFDAFGLGPDDNVNYTGNCSGERTFYRLFEPETESVHNFVMQIDGKGVNFISAQQPFSSSSQMKVEFKAPSQTGWLDAWGDFSVGMYSDGSGGRRLVDGAGRELGTPWGLTLGARATGLSGGKVILKLTVPQNFSGSITRIGFTF
jgi:hypothetical protein